MAPQDPLIFHITHLRNLPSILASGGLLSDAARRRGSFAATNIGHLHIKDRRMSRVVPCAACGVLGDYVPFNFCSRSVMLYAVKRGHQDYPGGDEEILHLVSSAKTAVALGIPWAFTDRHAELAYAQYFDDLGQLDKVRWDVMPQEWWQSVKEERQAEFLVHQFFPWSGIREIWGRFPACAESVQAALRGQAHQPTLAVRPSSYY